MENINKWSSIDFHNLKDLLDGTKSSVSIHNINVRLKSIIPGEYRIIDKDYDLDSNGWYRKGKFNYAYPFPFDFDSTNIINFLKTPDINLVHFIVSVKDNKITIKIGKKIGSWIDHNYECVYSKLARINLLRV